MDLGGGVIHPALDEKTHPSYMRDEECSLVAPYLLLQREDAGQREHDLREVFTCFVRVKRGSILGSKSPALWLPGRDRRGVPITLPRQKNQS